ncbi:MAG: hypothetical protein ACRCV6_08285 [Formosimonas sp.]
MDDSGKKENLYQKVAGKINQKADESIIGYTVVGVGSELFFRFMLHVIGVAAFWFLSQWWSFLVFAAIGLGLMFLLPLGFYIHSKIKEKR